MPDSVKYVNVFVAHVSLFLCLKCRIQEEREERHKRKKNDPVGGGGGGGGYGDLDIPLSGRSSKNKCFIRCKFANL